MISKKDVGEILSILEKTHNYLLSEITDDRKKVLQVAFMKERVLLLHYFLEHNHIYLTEKMGEIEETRDFCRESLSSCKETNF